MKKAFFLPLVIVLVLVAVWPTTATPKNWLAGAFGAGVVGLGCLLLKGEVQQGKPRTLVFLALVAAILIGLKIAIAGAGG